MARPRIVIVVEGGAVQGVFMGSLDPAGVDVVLIDHDTEGADEAQQELLVGGAYVGVMSADPLSALAPEWREAAAEADHGS